MAVVMIANTILYYVEKTLSRSMDWFTMFTQKCVSLNAGKQFLNLHNLEIPQ